MCQASVPAKDACVKMPGVTCDFTHFKLDPQAAMRFEVVLGVFRRGPWSLGQYH